MCAVVDAYAAADLSGVERTGDDAGIFAGKQLCVMVDNYKSFGTSKQGLEKLIHKHHGTCVQNPMDSTHFVIAASDHKLKVRCVPCVGLLKVRVTQVLGRVCGSTCRSRT